MGNVSYPRIAAIRSRLDVLKDEHQVTFRQVFQQAGMLDKETYQSAYARVFRPMGPRRALKEEELVALENAIEVLEVDIELNPRDRLDMDQRRLTAKALSERIQRHQTLLDDYERRIKALEIEVKNLHLANMRQEKGWDDERG